MNLFSQIFALTLVTFTVPAVTYAQQSQTKEQSLFAQSKMIAYEMGRTYQSGKNCHNIFDGISEARAATLFHNYYNKQQTQEIMIHYRKAVIHTAEKACNLGTIKVTELLTKIGDYMRASTPPVHDY